MFLRQQILKSLCYQTSFKALTTYSAYVVVLYLCDFAAAQADNVAVLYPQIREPYRQVFLNITSGVEREYGGKVVDFAIDGDTKTENLQAWFNDNQVNGVVALGRAGVRSLEPMTLEVPAVVGALVMQPNSSNYTGITQNPSPSQLFDSVRALINSLSIIHVVHEPSNNNWVIQQATAQAEALGMTLMEYPVSGLREAAETYRKIQDTMNSKRDALWLPVGAPSRDSAILQNILATAWNKDQIVISSNLADVRRGALFSMYPDNVAMGQELARLLKQRQENPQADTQILFVTTLLKAINLRSAEHIGLHFSKDELKQFDYMYPPP